MFEVHISNRLVSLLPGQQPTGQLPIILNPWMIEHVAAVHRRIATLLNCRRELVLLWIGVQRRIVGHVRLSRACPVTHWSASVEESAVPDENITPLRQEDLLPETERRHLLGKVAHELAGRPDAVALLNQAAAPP